MAVLGGVFQSGDGPIETSVSDCLDASGQFTCILRDGEHTAVVNDFYGFQPIFYFDGEVRARRLFAASNRYICLVRHLRKAGAVLSVDQAHLANQIYSSHSFFQQAYDHRTGCSQIRLLPVDRYLILTGKEVGAATKPKFTSALSRAGRYGGLLDEAASRMVDDLRTISRSDKVTLLQQSLSGGRDSRLTLGLCIKAGVGTKLYIRTEDVAANPGDLRISAALVAYYGLNWFAGDNRAQEAISSLQGLELWRYFQSNLYHRIGFASHIAAASNPGTMEITGGCGEVFRGYWSPFARRRGIGARSSTAELMKAYRYLIQTDFLPKLYREEAEAIFIGAIDALPGDHLLEKFDNHYLYFRNRAHFGGSDFRHYLSNMTWHPLASPELLKASRLLSDERRNSGEMLYDLQERFVPRLNNFEYDKNPWNFHASETKQGMRPHNLPLPVGNIDAWRECEHSRKRQLDEARTEKARFTRAEHHDTVRNEIERCIAVLSADGASALFGDGFARMWYEVYAGETKAAADARQELLSKLYSAVECLDPNELWAGQYKVIHVADSPPLASNHPAYSVPAIAAAPPSR